MATQLTKAEQRKRDATLLRIAQERMLMKDLTTTKSSADFHETAVWCVKDALEAAYAAGLEAGVAKAPPNDLGSWLRVLDDLVRNCDGVGGLNPRLVTQAEMALDEIRERLNVSASPNAHVGEAHACPHCGETHQDKLVWQDDETIECASCGTRYELNHGN